MTGGIVVVLGPTGRNVGAGMTGGITFLLDTDKQVSKRITHEIVEIHPLSNKKQEDILKPLIHKHWLQTKSFQAEEILKDWEASKQLFKVLIPPSEKDKVGL